MKGKGALFISMILGLIAMAAVLVYIKREKDKIFEDTKAVKVLIAKRDIFEMERIDDGMVQFLDVPQKFMQPKAVSSLEEVVGQVCAVPIIMGEQILATKLVAFGWETGLSMKIPPSMRALSIPVSDVTGVAGLVKPGNYVDIYGTFKVRDKAGEDVYEATRILLENVRVLAVERQMGALSRETERVEEADAAKGGARSDIGMSRREEYPKNMTLSVTPSQAAKVITAVAAGMVTVTLRSRLETEEEVGVADMDVRDIIGKDKVIPAKRRPEWVEIRGSERTFD